MSGCGRAKPSQQGWGWEDWDWDREGAVGNVTQNRDCDLAPGPGSLLVLLEPFFGEITPWGSGRWVFCLFPPRNV